MTTTLLTILETHSGETLIGIVDFITTKKLFFFDITDNMDDHLLLVIMWSGNTDRRTRFSVFCAINFPHISLPKAKLLTINNIKSSTTPLIPSSKPKTKKRKIKFVNMATK